MSHMSLETEVTKGFLVSLQLLCFYGDLREIARYINVITTQLFSYSLSSTSTYKFTFCELLKTLKSSPSANSTLRRRNLKTGVSSSGNASNVFRSHYAGGI